MEKRKLDEIIKSYKNMYFEIGLKKIIINKFIKHIDYKTYKMLYYSQKYKFYKEMFKKKKNIIFFIKYIFYGIKYFKYSCLTNCEIYGYLGKNVKIFHGGVVINDKSVIGNNVKFHGNNCIGNNGIDDKAPHIGNNVDIGFGATVIGDVVLADNIIVGANSVVTKSFAEEGIIIAGCPACKIIK